MKLLALLVFAGLALASAAIVDPQYAQYGHVDQSALYQQQLEQAAYQQYLQQLQSAQTDAAYVFDSIDNQQAVECPSGTRGLSIPPAHVRFWHSLKLTRNLMWSGQKQFMCVPQRLRMTLVPIIKTLKKEKYINVDPMQVPEIQEIVEKVEEVSVPSRDISIEELAAMRAFRDDLEISAAQGWGRWGWGGWGGRGWGWGGPGFGWGGFGGWGFPGYGFGWGWF